MLAVTEDYETSLERLVTGRLNAAALDFQAGAMIAIKLYPEGQRPEQDVPGPACSAPRC